MKNETNSMNWFKIAQVGDISIVLDEYVNSLKERIDQTVAYSAQEAARLNAWKPDINAILLPIQQLGYDTTVVGQAMQNNDADTAWAECYKIKDLVYKRPPIDNQKTYQQRQQEYAQWDAGRKSLRQIMDYFSKQNVVVFSEQDGQVEFQKLYAQTAQNMQAVSNQISQAISRITDWYGSPITISARSLEKENDIAPEEDASIAVGQNANFTYFVMDGKVVIDDVLEGGGHDEEEFFSSPKVRSDYFNLINELRKPGSTSKGGKMLTLYTARPVKDREMYMSATTIPPNLFLTRNADFAANFGADYNEKRDVWKVRIDSRYLVQTLEGTGQEQYQVVGTGPVPVKSIELIMPAE